MYVILQERHIAFFYEMNSSVFAIFFHRLLIISSINLHDLSDIKKTKEGH